MNYIGVDLGTSSIKMLLIDRDGNLLRSVSKEYPISYPHDGWSEQDPEAWYNAMMTGLRELIDGTDAGNIGGISFGGQMHGLVVLDAYDRVIRPAILWNDGRSEKEVAFLNGEIGVGRIAKWTGNIAFAGFTAPKLLWMKANEPELFSRIKKIMLPKDFLVYRLTGIHCTDVSDASGMLLFDVQNRRWSQQMIDLCGIREDQLGRVYESYQVVGMLKPEAAAFLGTPGLRVVAGAGDNAAAAVGTGTVREGQCMLSLGTSGTLFIPLQKFKADPDHALHSFADSTGRFHLLGCMLAAASCGKWWMEDVLKTDAYDAEQRGFTADGENHVYFLPYLMGERSPHNNASARGVFFGMNMGTTRAQMTQAVYEGVTFGLRDSLEVARALGTEFHTIMLCGGGAKSRVWRQMVADIMNTAVELPLVEEGPSFGAAILAAVGCGEYDSVETAAGKLIRVKETIEPNQAAVAEYDKRFRFFHEIYPQQIALFAKAASMR